MISCKGKPSSPKQITHDSVAHENALRSQAKIPTGSKHQLAPIEIGRSTTQAVSMILLTEIGLQPMQVNPLRRAQLCDDTLVIPLVHRKRLLLVRHIAPLGRGDIVKKRAQVPPTRSAIKRVGSRTDADIVYPLPITAIVPRAETRKCEVRNLIMLIAGGKKPVPQAFESLHTLLLIDGDDLAPLTHIPQTRTLLIGQMVGRDMRNTQGDGLPEAIVPLLLTLARHTIDKVDADVGQPHALATTHGLDGLLRRMTTPHKAQRSIVERLHPYADPIKREHTQLAHILLRQVVGVSLERQFSPTQIKGDREAGQGKDDAIQYPPQLINTKRRRRTATKVDGSDRLATQPRQTKRQLATYRIDICLTMSKQCRRKKVAIGTTALTKRDMYIYTSHNWA